MKNWSIIAKYFFAIVPLIGIFVFLLGQSIDLLSDPESFWTIAVGNKAEKFEENFYEKLLSWNLAQQMLFLFCRNFLTFTTIINLATSVFWIYSIKNHKAEGTGKFDNYKYALIILCGTFWITLFYNMSLTVTGATKFMKWYNYISWLTEHSIPQIAMLIYFFAFYKKINVTTNNKNIVLMWASTISVVTGYLVFFTITGLICQAVGSFPFFGDMSSTGHYPYDILDLTSANKRVNLPGLTPITQWLACIFGFSAVNSVYFVGGYFICRKQGLNNVTN
ncbi:hypothetical protein [Spiroplasma culicicola]|uniref:Transmembrane protein n=1 Tax=Spiroplasma culicicola AES-1 TaxID=1276246 RepID=W6A8L5_9MOLU|nr:hypothetical protein [Spiroplasma culicicola]AHI53311.1 hypothetical protein SCULI_v1c09710 [Spiroplasma culicicola AES-1]